MISKSQKARLAVFVIIGASLLALFFIIPYGMKFSDRQKTYFSFFEGESLSGLEEGATVKFHGVAIGKVIKISYDPKNLSRVKVQLSIKEDFPLKTDMFAQTGMLGITGLMYLEILGGTNEAPLLKADSELKTKPSMIATITGKAEGIIAKVEMLLNHLNTISSPDSLRSVKEILDNVAVITHDSRTFLDNVRPNIEQMAQSTRSVLMTTDSISRDIKILTAGLRASADSGKITAIITSLDSTAHSLKSLSENLNLTLTQTREDITVTLENLRTASESADEFAKALADDPSVLIRGDQRKERDIR